jgi:flagellar motor switch protein FliM
LKDLSFGKSLFSRAANMGIYMSIVIMTVPLFLLLFKCGPYTGATILSGHYTLARIMVENIMGNIPNENSAMLGNNYVPFL